MPDASAHGAPVGPWPSAGRTVAHSVLSFFVDGLIIATARRGAR